MTPPASSGGVLFDREACSMKPQPCRNRLMVAFFERARLHSLLKNSTNNPVL